VSQQNDYFIQQQKTKEGTGGRWYTDIGAETESSAKPISELTPEEVKQRNEEFWKTPVENTPETRKAIHKKLEEERAAVEEQRKGIRTNQVPKRETVLEREGKRLNLNQAKWPFLLDDTSNVNSVKLEVTLPKYLSTQNIDVDVQPTYVKIVAENRTFQLVLNEEICPDKSSCQRSQMTGVLVLTMPTVKQTIVPEKCNSKSSFREENSKLVKKPPSSSTAYLEVDPSKKSDLDFSSIVSDSSKSKPMSVKRTVVKEKDVSDDFVDDPDVPPLF
jgi:protein TilB